MRLKRRRGWLAGALAACALIPGGVRGQVLRGPRRALASNVVVPQRRAFALHGRRAVRITEVQVSVVILEQAATTTMDISLHNPGGSRQEAELIVPVPEGPSCVGSRSRERPRNPPPKF